MHGFSRTLGLELRLRKRLVGRAGVRVSSSGVVDFGPRQ